MRVLGGGTWQGQTGGYWATPQHHVLAFIGMHDKGMACRLLNDAIATYRLHSIWEWADPFYSATSYGDPGYIASAAGTYFASAWLRCWEQTTVLLLLLLSLKQERKQKKVDEKSHASSAGVVRGAVEVLADTTERLLDPCTCVHVVPTSKVVRCTGS